MQLSIRIFLIFLLMIPLFASGQKMSYSMQSNSPDIQITKGEDLDFGFVIKGNQNMSKIELEEERAGWVKITAPRYEELEVLLEVSDALTLAQYEIPVEIKATFANTNTATIKEAKISSIELPGDIDKHSIPVVGQKITGGPPQPKTHHQNPNAVSDVYLFFYGTAGPASINLPAGTYSGNIFITVSLKNR